MIITEGKIFRKDYMHPDEENAMLEIQHSGTYNHIAKLAGSIRLRTHSVAELIVRGYPVTKKSCPRLYRIYKDVLKKFGSEEIFPLFIDFGYEIKAKSFGSDKDGHIILVNSACLEKLSNNELAALIGREIAHILSGHVENRELLDSIGLFTDKLPALGDIVEKKLLGFFAKWLIVSEYTADRAGAAAAGSVGAVISLIKKQIGCEKISEEQLVSQQVESEPDILGIYYILMTEKLNVFGGIKRIQELAEWKNSDEFKKNYPYMYYESSKNDEDILVLLHKRAANGNYMAAGQLGEYYLFGKNGLPRSPYTAVSLLTEAAYYGDGKSMYYLAECMKTGVAGIKNDKVLMEQLLLAARSRIGDAAILANGIKTPLKLQGFENIFPSFDFNRSLLSNCKYNIVSPGKPIQDECIDDIRSAMFMTADENILAYEVWYEEKRLYGTVIAETGIYCRLQEDSFPVIVRWHEFMEWEAVQKPDDGIKYFFSGQRRIYKCQEGLNGTLGQLIILLVKNLKRRR